MKDIALLLLRGVSGSLVAGHGAQKLFGWFGGGGIEGTMGMVRRINLKPARPWAYLAALSEFGGGTLTALGLLNPVGPVAYDIRHVDGHRQSSLGQADLGNSRRPRATAHQYEHCTCNSHYGSRQTLARQRAGYPLAERSCAGCGPGAGRGRRGNRHHNERTATIAGSAAARAVHSTSTASRTNHA